MLFDPEKQESNDYFDGPDLPEPVKEPKKPQYKPEDPDYWEEDESEWDHLKPSRKSHAWLWIALVVVIAGVGIGGWLRYFSPYVACASQYGYVEHLERRGTIFKTYEGVLLPYRALADTTRLYSRDFIFTAADKEVFKRLRVAQKECIPVCVEYKKYHATLPWRGASKILVTAVDTVNPANILPPEFAPVDSTKVKAKLL